MDFIWASNASWQRQGIQETLCVCLPPYVLSRSIRQEPVSKVVGFSRTRSTSTDILHDEATAGWTGDMTTEGLL